jgi:hypothetical protein
LLVQLSPLASSQILPIGACSFTAHSNIPLCESTLPERSDQPRDPATKIFIISAALARAQSAH